MQNNTKILFSFLFSLSCCNASSEDEIHIYTAKEKQTFIVVITKNDCARSFITDGRNDWIYFSSWSNNFYRTVNNTGSIEKEGLKFQFDFNEMNGKLIDSTTNYDLNFEEIKFPAGLYMSYETFDNNSYLGGWIFLENGEQRGSLEINSDMKISALLDSWDQKKYLTMDGIELNVNYIGDMDCPDISVSNNSGNDSSNNSSNSGSNDSNDSANGTCCRYCNKGKPCGDGCIPYQNECHIDRGCAC